MKVLVEQLAPAGRWALPSRAGPRQFLCSRVSDGHSNSRGITSNGHCATDTGVTRKNIYLWER